MWGQFILWGATVASQTNNWCFDWVFERANSQREQRKTLLQLSALFLRLSVSVAAIIRFCSWPMRARGTENVYIQYVSAAKCCCRGQQPVSNGLLWIGGRILCLSTCLSTLFTSLCVRVCLCERVCVCVCVHECVCRDYERGRADETQQTDTANMHLSVFFFSCLSISHSSPLPLHLNAPRLGFSCYLCPVEG